MTTLLRAQMKTEIPSKILLRDFRSDERWQLVTYICMHYLMPLLWSLCHHCKIILFSNSHSLGHFNRNSKIMNRPLLAEENIRNSTNYKSNVCFQACQSPIHIYRFAHILSIYHFIIIWKGHNCLANFSYFRSSMYCIRRINSLQTEWIYESYACQIMSILYKY